MLHAFYIYIYMHARTHTFTSDARITVFIYNLNYFGIHFVCCAYNLGTVVVVSVFENVSYPRTSDMKSYKNLTQLPEVLFLPPFDPDFGDNGGRYVDPAVTCLTNYSVMMMM